MTDFYFNYAANDCYKCVEALHLFICLLSAPLELEVSSR